MVSSFKDHFRQSETFLLLFILYDLYVNDTDIYIHAFC